MIIKRVTIQNWRGLRHFDAELLPGFNILRGRNEAGKSSVVEAIAWALHRDLASGARVRDEIAPILPTDQFGARPSVELLLEFPDCTATITKTLAEEAASRECCLTVRREGRADQICNYNAAQNELRRLIASDGALSAPTSSGVDVALLISAQGQSTHFIGQELSSAARSSIALGEDGAIAATSRLEKVRVALEKKRGRELFEKLKPNAVDAAKKATDAARVRDELAQLRQEHAKYGLIEAQIAELRAQIKSIIERYDQVAPRAEQTQREWEELRARQSAQQAADVEVAELRRAFGEAKTSRDALHNRVEELMKLREENARAQTELQQLQGQLETAQIAQAQCEEKTQLAWQAHLEAEKARDETRNRVLAWDRYLEVCASHRERARRRKQWEEIEKLQLEVEARQAEVETLGRAPLRAQINRWREVYFAIENARRLASQTLQISLRLENAADVKFRADDGQTQVTGASAGEETLLGAQASVAWHLPGVGKFSAVTSGREAHKQSAEIEGKIRSLEKDMAPFGITLADLPDALQTMEEAGATIEAASQQLQFCRRQYESLLANQSPEEWRALLQGAHDEYCRARQACEPFRAFIPEGVKTAQANIERERAREAENEIHQNAERARRVWQQSLARQSETSNALAGLQARAEALENARGQSAQRLSELENDGLDDDSRAGQLDEWNRELWRAKSVRDEAIGRREEMGPGVADETLMHLAHEERALREEQHALENELGAKRATLRGFCEQDPQTEMDNLEWEIALREEEIVRHESRLRGVAILEAALDAERHRLGRAIAAPLNEYLSPWLTELRGKATRVEFDEGSGKIIGVQTRSSDGSTHVLPFGSHSGGMQEQTALALRLILAQSAAKKLPNAQMPLVLDDPLTQTDTRRREGLWRVLRQASTNLQIVFVTCHETHLPTGIEANFLTLGDWPEAEASTPLPAVEEISTAKKNGKPRRAKSTVKMKNGAAANGKAATNGDAREEALPNEPTETLSLW